VNNPAAAPGGETHRGSNGEAHAHAQRILIVDDDWDIRTLLADVLVQAGFAVATAANGAEMREALDRDPVDLIVLDLNLPGEDGLTLCRELRASNETPIIILSARADPIDRVLGLELGSDDYLTKPFEPRELVARIRSVLRRLEHRSSERRIRRAVFHHWALDFEHRHLVDSRGRIIMLSGAEYTLLRAMIDHAHEVLTREQIAALGLCSCGEGVGRAIDLQVSRLRQKLDDDARASEIIKTVRNRGYVFASSVRFE
jgi:two-component system OmpR family response regulator